MPEKDGMMRDKNHDDAIADMYKDDPALAAAVLDSVLADGNKGDLLIVLRQMSKAFGGISKLAEAAKLNKTQIYRILSRNGNPTIGSMGAILKTMGLRLSV